LSPTLIEGTVLGLLTLEKPLAKKRGFMKKEVNELEDELRPEYDFSKMAGGVRGKYVERYRAGTNLVLLEPDIAQAFPTDALHCSRLLSASSIEIRLEQTDKVSRC
jgi:hypothetical protein